tara:strand:+ start:297 stop:428 length:132 start_codon:yes stop_codon:yes gene_type:complete
MSHNESFEAEEAAKELTIHAAKKSKAEEKVESRRQKEVRPRLF